MVILVCLLPLGIWAAETWTGAGFENSPLGSDPFAAGALKIRQLKAEIRARAAVEHQWGDTDSTNDDNGLHRLGSARCFIGASAPTVLVESMTDYNNAGGAGEGTLGDPATNSAAGATDDVGHGRCWFDSDDGYKAYVYVGETCTNLFDDVGVPQTTGSPDGFCDSDGTTPTGWTAASAVADSITGVIADDELLEGSFNYVYNGSFDISDGTGSAYGGSTTICTDLFDDVGVPQTTGSPDGFCDSDGTTASATPVPAGWADITSPTHSYDDPSGDTRWGDGFSITVANAGTTNEGIQYTLTNLPSDTVFKVIARAIDDGTSVCTLDVTNEGGTAFVPAETTTDDWETLTGTFGTSAGSLDTVELTLVTTGADLLTCTWDHVGVYQVGDVSTDRDEVAPNGTVAVYDSDAAESLTPATMTAVPDLTADFTPPTSGWVVQVGATVSAGCASGCFGGSVGLQCQLQLGGVAVTGSTVETKGNYGAGSSSVSIQLSTQTVNVDPTAGTPLVYTVACDEIGTNNATYNHNSNESNLWLIAHPPH